MSRSIFKFEKTIGIRSCAAVVGELEFKGPLKKYFDLSSQDSKFGMDTWEKAEAEMVRQSAEVAIKKAKLAANEIDLAFGGDLTNQCASTTFGIKEQYIPYLGLYGACSTFALSMGLAAMSIECGLAQTTLSVASSHFCSAERQYRFPLEYGCQRTPTAQTTVTGAGCVILEENDKAKIKISEFLPGIIVDAGITDANNMGAAMAPACADTLLRYFSQTTKKPEEFDAILSGDLGLEGKRILRELCSSAGLDLSDRYFDCGELIYDVNSQEVGAGGSGCGCSASVFSGYIASQLREGNMKDVLLIGTGALLNPNTVLQKETIPGVAHLVRIQKEKI